MKSALSTTMAKITALTKSGKLHDATALIQASLRPSTPLADTLASGAIEGEFTRLDDHAPQPKMPIRPRRTGLAETLRKIAAGGMPGTTITRSSPEPLPSGAQFLSLSHTSPHGHRDYRLYIPAKPAQTPMPLIVMLHGCTQSPEDFAAGTGMNLLAEEFGCMVAYPAQPSGANAQKCWNWFRPGDQSRDQGEPAIIAALTRGVLRDYPADPSRVYIAGLSAGAAAAAIAATAYPDIFSAVGVHSGLPVGSAHDVVSAFSAMRSGASGHVLRTPVPIIAFHGLADATVHPDNGTAVIEQMLPRQSAMTRTTRRGATPNGHSYRQTVHTAADGSTIAEYWEVEQASHAWSGGHTSGTYTDPKGPNASREMVRFFLQHTKR